VIDRV